MGWPRSVGHQVDGIVGWEMDYLNKEHSIIQPQDYLPLVPRNNGLEERYNTKSVHFAQTLDYLPVTAHPIKLPSMVTVVLTTMPTVATTTQERDLEIMACTTTMAVRYRWNNIDWVSPVRTVYKTIVTEISGMDCQGCELEIKHFRGANGPGLVVPYHATVTKELTTTTVPACLPSSVIKD